MTSMQKIKRMLVLVTNVVVIAGLLGLFAYNALAKEVDLALNVNKDTISPGEVVEITLSLDDADGGQYNALEGVISYDKTVFEEISSDNLTALNEWSGFVYNEITQKFVLYRHDIVENAFLKIQLTALEETSAESTEISITNFNVSDGTKDISLSAKTDLTITHEDTGTGEEGGGEGTGDGEDSGETGGSGTGDGGNTDSGNTGSGDSGNTDSGNTGSGDGGNTDSGNTGSGDNGNTDPGNTDGGNTGTGDGGNTDGGNTDSGNTDSGNTGSGSTDSGNTDSGNTGSGSTDSGNTGTGGNTDSGNTGTGTGSGTNSGTGTGTGSGGSTSSGSGNSNTGSGSGNTSSGSGNTTPTTPSTGGSNSSGSTSTPTVIVPNNTNTTGNTVTVTQTTPTTNKNIASNTQTQTSKTNTTNNTTNTSSSSKKKATISRASSEEEEETKEVVSEESTPKEKEKEVVKKEVMPEKPVVEEKLQDMAPPVMEEDDNDFFIFIVILGICFLLLIVLLIAYLLYRKYSAAGLFFIVLLLLFNGINTRAASLKGDLNKDGLCNEADYQILANHLAGISPIENTLKDVADMNSNGLLTITDLSILLRYQLPDIKETPTVSEVTIDEDKDAEKITVNMTVTDTDGAIKTGQISLVKDGTTVESIEITNGQNRAEFSVLPNVLYQVKIQIEYDKVPGNEGYDGSINTTLEYKMIKEIPDPVDPDPENPDPEEPDPDPEPEEVRQFQLKDVEEVVFINKHDGGLLYDVDLDVLNADDYFAEIYMKDIPAVYAPIKNITAENDELVMELDYSDSISYRNGEKVDGTFIKLGDMVNGELERDAINNLIAEIVANPSGTITLTRDYDAKNITDVTTLTGNNFVFRGVLDGNGYTIKNMRKGLFNRIEGATIKNLNIENANTTGTKGLITNQCVNSTIQNVSVVNSIMKECDNSAGAVVGEASGSTLKNIAVENISLQGSNTIGGLAGQVSSNSSVTNCYVSGYLKASMNHWLGTRIGGITGWHSGVTIDKCVSNVVIESNTTDSNGGFIGGPHDSSVNISNSLAVIEGNSRLAYGFTGATLVGNNVYAYAVDNKEAQTGVTTVTNERRRQKSFYTSMGFSETDWEFRYLDFDGVPTLKKVVTKDAQSDNKRVYIPNYALLREMPEYTASKDILYHNLYKMEPFYEAEALVEDGARISTSHALNQKYIKSIIPFDASGKAVLGLSLARKDEIASIKVLYEDDSTDVFDVTFKDDKNFVANYTLDEFGTGYNFSKYLVDTNLPMFTSNVAKIQTMDYATTIEPLTWETDNRNIYWNFPSVQENASEFLIKLFANNPEYQSSKDSIINGFIRNELPDEFVDEYVCAYNYYDRCYDIEIGGINMRDIIFFDMSIFNKDVDAYTITQEFINVPDYVDRNGTHISNRNTWRNVPLYNTVIKPYVGKSMGMFFEYFITKLAEDEYKNNPNEWFHDNFDGFIYEAPAKDFMNPADPLFMEYRVWEHLKRREDYILAFLTYHGDDLYFVTYPTAMMYGNLRLYFSDWDNNHPTDEQIAAKVEEFTDQAANLYNTVAHIVDDATVKRMSDRTDVVHDSTRNQNLFGLDTFVANIWDVNERGAEPNIQPVDPVYKYVSEFANKFHNHGSAAAYANTVGEVFYCFYSTLGSYSIWTHENIHNQDNYVYFENKGRRLWNWHGNSENFADGLITQGKSSGDLVANYSTNYPWEENVGYNQTFSSWIDGVSRAQARENYHIFYQNAMEAKRFMDYLEGMTFCDLTPQQQANIAATVGFYDKVYADKSNPDATADWLTPEQVAEREQETCILGTRKRKRDAEFFANANIQNIAGLFDNNVIIERNAMLMSLNIGYIFSNTGMVGEGFKNNAFVMAAEGGYDSFSDWGGSIYSSDLQVLRAATGEDDITYRDYTLRKYGEVENNINAHLNFSEEEIETYKDMFREALIRDGDNDNVFDRSEGYVVREILYTRLKRMTNDFKTSIFTPVSAVNISSATGLINALKNDPLGTYVITNDLNFDGISGDEFAMIDRAFMGEIRGNGRTIRNLSKPLFNDVRYARIYDLNIEDANITLEGHRAGVLSNYTLYSIIKNVNLNRTNITGGDSTGGLIGRAERSIFENITSTDGYVSCNLERSGGLFGYIEISSVRKCHVKNLTHRGASRSGGLIGEGQNLFRIVECSVNADVQGRNDVGGFAGRLQNSRPENNSRIVQRCFEYNTYLEDCYSLGRVRADNNVGGFLGYGENITVSRCFSNVSFEPSNQNGGGFVGFVGYTDGKNAEVAILSVSNCISFSNCKNGTKFDGQSRVEGITRAFENNYEYEGSRGRSTRERTTVEDWNGKVDTLTESNVSNVTFYRNLGFRDDVWDLTNIPNGMLPKLKDPGDTNNAQSIKTVIEINTANDFLKINDNPFASYALMQDIDLEESDSDLLDGSYITSDFVGILEGNENTIYNASKPLFANITNAEIKNLRVENLEARNVQGGFARNINGSKLTNIYIDRASVVSSATMSVGVLGVLPQNSTFSRISLTNIYVEGSNTVGGLFGQANTNTTMSDIYVEGTIVGTNPGGAGYRLGGFVGWNSAGVIERAVSRVTFEAANGSNCGGLVGGPPSNPPAMSNALTVVSGKSNAISGCTDTSMHTNLYELPGEGVNTQANDTTVFSITPEDLVSRTFFTTRLELDPDIWDLDNLESNGGPVLKGVVREADDSLTQAFMMFEWEAPEEEIEIIAPEEIIKREYPTQLYVGGVYNYEHKEDGSMEYPYLTLTDALENAIDGDTIILLNNVYVEEIKEGDYPLILDKEVTIKSVDGNTFNIHIIPTGIILEKDVTFEDVSLQFATNNRNCIVANGHSLTLNNVTSGSYANPLTIFGGQDYKTTTGYDGFNAVYGEKSFINITGKSEIGAIYAGNFSNASYQRSEFASSIPVEVNISYDGEELYNKTKIYAHGAYQEYNNDKTNVDSNVFIADALHYPVTAAVDINITGDTVSEVHGDKGYSYADVNYTANSSDGGMLVDKAGSLNLRHSNNAYLVLTENSVLGENTDIDVPKGAVLDISALEDEIYVDTFNGGGKLVMRNDQTLIPRSVTGSTLVETIGIMPQEYEELSEHKNIDTSLMEGYIPEDSFVMIGSADYVGNLYTVETQDMGLLDGTKEEEEEIIEEVSFSFGIIDIIEFLFG